MKVAVVGGHFSPAVSVISELKGEEVILIGRKHALDGDQALSFEYLVCKEKKIPFFNIHAGRFQRDLSWHSLLSIINFCLGVIESLKILAKFRPDVVVTFGGYLSLPVAAASYLQNIPIVIHEQSQKAGIANKLVSHVAKKICISFDSSTDYFPKEKTILTGNPIRREIFNVLDKLNVSDAVPIIYITGGSTGSHFINDLVYKSLQELTSLYVVIHQTGNAGKYNDYEKLRLAKKSLAKSLQNRYFLKKFILPNEIGWVFKKANLVVGRAGANTVCELLCLGKMCLLIPLPHGQADEQHENARLVEEIGIGDYMLENDVTKESFIDKIRGMVKNKDEYLRNAKAAQKYYIANATQKIIDVIRLVNEEKKKGK